MQDLILARQEMARGEHQSGFIKLFYNGGCIHYHYFSPLFLQQYYIYIYIEGVCQDLILSCIKTTPMALSGEHSKKKQSANEQCVYVYICVHDGSG
jgi:hypothetical protein